MAKIEKRNPENTEEKEFSKTAILMGTKGVKKDALKFLLDDDKTYSLRAVDEIYKNFLKGGI